MRLRHYKGGIYTVIGRGRHSETLEDMIIYRSEKDGKVWIRPVKMLHDEVQFEGETVLRFQPIDNSTKSEKWTIIASFVALAFIIIYAIT